MLRGLTGRAVLGCAAALALLALPACEVDRLDLVVNDPGTGGDASVGDEVCEATAGVGDCTLRAAIDEANATPSTDLVTVAPGIEPAPSGPLVVSDSLVLDGGGVVLGDRVVHDAGRLTLRDLSIEGTTDATACGGAVASTGLSVGLQRVTIRDTTTAAGSGGGVCATGDLVVTESTITGNRVTAAGGGGAGIVTAGQLVLLRSTVADNRLTTGTPISQVQTTGPGTAVVAHSTIVPTASSLAFAALDVAPATDGRVVASTIRGIAALNPGIEVGASVLGRCTGTPSSLGHNLVTDASCPSSGTDRLVTDPALAGLDVPQAWSPALDAIPAGTPGLCPGPLATDRRGGARPLHGACDIGAVELESRVRSSSLTSVGTGLGGALRAQAVNDAGVIAGGAYAGDIFNPRAATWAPDGSSTLLSTDPSLALGISPGGIVVGRHQPGGGTTRAFRWDPAVGTVQDLGTLPGDTHAGAVDSDDAGVVVGNSSGPSGSRAWVWTPDASTLAPLPSLGGPTSVAAVNADGTAVGYSDLPAGGSRRAVVWDLAAGTLTDIGAGAAPDGSWAVDIDDDGVVIGTVSRPDLGEDCEDPDFGTPACPFSQPFRWDPATGELTQIEGLLGPVQAAAFGPEGTIVEHELRYVFGCAGCPDTASRAYLCDPLTGEHTRITATDLTPLDANASGQVVGNGIDFFGPGSSLSVGKQLTVSLAG